MATAGEVCQCPASAGRNGIAKDRGQISRSCAT